MLSQEMVLEVCIGCQHLVLHPCCCMGEAQASDGVSPVQEAKDEGSAARVGGSKKDPTVRRREIVGQGPESLGHALTEAATASAASLLQSMLGSDVLVEVACGGEAGECTLTAPVSPSRRHAFQCCLPLSFPYITSCWGCPSRKWLSSDGLASNRKMTQVCRSAGRAGC